MNPIYDLFNRSYIEQQAKQQNHLNQIYEIEKSAKALKDFLDGVDKIQYEYQKDASAAYSAVIYDYFKKHNMI